jgi:hypothetical protein
MSIDRFEQNMRYPTPLLKYVWRLEVARNSIMSLSLPISGPQNVIYSSVHTQENPRIAKAARLRSHRKLLPAHKSQKHEKEGNHARRAFVL